MSDFMILPEKSLLGNEIPMEMLMKHIKPNYIDLFKKDIANCMVYAILRKDTCGIPEPTNSDDVYREIVFLTLSLNNDMSYEIIAKQILLSMPYPVVLTLLCKGRYAHATATSVRPWKRREYLNKLDNFRTTFWYEEDMPSPLSEINYCEYSSYKNLFIKICSAIESSTENYIRISFLAKVVMYCRGYDMDESFNMGTCVALNQEIKAKCKSVSKWGSGEREIFLFSIDDAWDFIVNTCHYVPAENFVDLMHYITEIDRFDLELPNSIQNMVDEIELDFLKGVSNLSDSGLSDEIKSDDNEYYIYLEKTFDDMLKTDR